MALERRGNNLYYYQKERRGGRVVSVYSGKGEMALLFHQLAQCTREEEEIKRKVVLEELEKLTRPDALIDEFGDEVHALESVLYLLNGYHQHSRSWRRLRRK